MSSSASAPPNNQRSWINISLYLGVTIISALLGLSSAVLMTHLLAPHEYGRIGIFLSVLYLAAPMIFLAADGLVAVNKSRLDNIEYHRFRRTAISIALMVFILQQLLTVIIFLSGNPIDPLLLLVPLFALLRFLSTMASTEYIAEQRAAIYAGLTLLNSLLAFILTYLLITQVIASASGRILALMCAEAVMLIFRYWGKFGLIFRPYLDIKYRKQIITFGLPSMVALFGAWGLNESDKVIVANEFGLATAGLYTVAASLAAIMTSFTQSLTHAFFPHMFAELRSGEQVKAVAVRWFFRFSGATIIFGIIMVIGYLLLKDLLLPIKYSNTSIYFYALVVASLGVAVYRPFGLIAEYLEMARTRSFAIIAGGGTTLCTAFFGVRWLDTPLMAALGMGVGYLVAASILAVALWLYSDESVGADLTL